MDFLSEMRNEEEKSDINVVIGNVFVLGFVVDMCPCPPLQVLTEGSPAREALPEAGHNLGGKGLRQCSGCSFPPTGDKGQKLSSRRSKYDNGYILCSMHNPLLPE